MCTELNWYIWCSPLKDFGSGYKKFSRVGFGPTAIEFHSDALNYWKFREWVQLARRAKFVQLLEFKNLRNISCSHQEINLCISTKISLLTQRSNFDFLLSLVCLWIFHQTGCLDVYNSNLQQILCPPIMVSDDSLKSFRKTFSVLVSRFVWWFY